jgi:hypothetical protein
VQEPPAAAAVDRVIPLVSIASTPQAQVRRREIISWERASAALQEPRAAQALSASLGNFSRPIGSLTSLSKCSIKYQLIEN